MKKTIILAVLLTFTISSNSYALNDSIAKACYHFTIQAGKLTGNGADTLRAHITASQFFLLGEEHDMAELSLFVKAALPFLARNGYRYFALEIGDYSADKLVSIYREGNSLFDFNTKYYQMCGETPIPFFEGKEDEAFLYEALDNGFKLWGIDQENYYSPPFIFEELYVRAPKREKLQYLYDNANQFVISEYSKSEQNPEHPIYHNLLNAKEIDDFFSRLPDNKFTENLIHALKTSWKIYDDARNNNWYSRIDFMKRNFIAHYKKAAEKDPLPKVFIKTGAVHLARGTTWSGFQDVGNTVYELANFNETGSFSVISFPRYRIDKKGNITDILDDETEKFLIPLLQNTRKDQWTLIDLNKIEKLRRQGKISLSGKIRSYIQKYDMMLIPPITKSATPNYRVE